MGNVLKDIMALNDQGVCETGRTGDIEEVCLRQTAGDSAGPQVDVIERLLRQRFGDNDIADEKPSTRFEDPSPLSQGPAFIG